MKIWQHEGRNCKWYLGLGPKLLQIGLMFMVEFFYVSLKMYPNTKIGFDVMDMSVAFGKGSHRYRLIAWPFVFVVGNH